MLYVNYINKAVEATIIQADNGLWYLEPLWREILYNEDLDITKISDAKVDWGGIFDVLQLEVKKRNTINDNKPYVMNWLYDLITATVEPAIMQEETDYIKQVIEFMKENHAKDQVREE